MSSLSEERSGTLSATRNWLGRVILLGDVFFLISLLYMPIAWWLVKDDFTFGSWTIHVKWRNSLLLLLLLPLLVRGTVAFRGEDSQKEHRSGLFRYRIFQRLTIVFFAFAVPLFVVEQILKRTNVEVRVAPIILDTGGIGLDHYHRNMLKDSDLLWKFEAGTRVFGRTINKIGFREREVPYTKEKGVKRVICLGDSVTAQGLPGYSQYLHDMLTNAPPDGGKWEAFNMGVYGYTSLQGLRLFETRVKDLHPDIVTVCYGRNDHNLCQYTDKVRMAVRLSPFWTKVYDIVDRRITGRMLLHAIDRGRHSMVLKNGEAGIQVRVPPDDFRENLQILVKEIRATGATPLLVTAPRRKIPDSYVQNGYARTPKEFEKQHDQYAEIVREVARETGAPLLDLQKNMAGADCDGMFAPDAVHFDSYEKERLLTLGNVDQPGLKRVATEMYGAIKAICGKSQN